MIKVSFIAPTSLIKEYGNRGDFHLVLSHLIEAEGKNAYGKAILESGLPILMDNGLFENGVAEDMDSLIGKASAMKAEYVYAPDVLYNRVETEKKVLEMIEKVKALPEGMHKPKVAAVVQADNVKDFTESYQTFRDNSDIALIGLSILSVPKSFAEVTMTDDISVNRLACLKHLSQVLADHKDTHLLGAGSSYEDVSYANLHCPWVVSHDSSSAIWNGVDKRRIDPATLAVVGGKTPKHVDFNFNEPLDDEQKEIIEANIALVLKATDHATES